MTAKRAVPSTSSGRRIAQGAVMLALAALQDERVRAQLAKAPAAARAWAASRRHDRAEESVLAKVDPTQRFGRRGLQRRLRALQRNADLVLPDRNDPTSEAMHRAIGELEQAAAISATMPLAQRRRARARIDTEMTRLEVALVDAVLPPADRPGPT